MSYPAHSLAHNKHVTTYCIAKCITCVVQLNTQSHYQKWGHFLYALLESLKWILDN